MQRVRLSSDGMMADGRPAGDRAPLRVVFLIGTLDIGGTERQLVELASRLDRRRFDPVIYCLAAPGPLADEARRRGVEVQSAHLKALRPWAHPLRFTRRLLRIYPDLKALQPHILHAFLFHAYTMGALLSALLRPKAFVSSRRSLGHFKANRRAALLLERMTNGVADVVVANSEAVRLDAIAQEGLAPERVIVIHNGVDIPAPVDALAVRRGLNIAPDVPLVAVVANFIAYKGHDCFLTAWRRVQDAVPGAVALLVGEGPTRARIEALAAEMRLTDTLRFLGSRTDVGVLLRAVDLVVHPSQQEGFSNAILEAMAAGCPVVATAVGGNAEAVTDGTTGLLVPSGDAAALAAAIERLLARPDERRRLGEAAQRRVEQSFSMDRMTLAYEQVYSAVIDRNSRGVRLSSQVPA
jgi:glycosyltransferase involved in cell wall biosynthesis